LAKHFGLNVPELSTPVKDKISGAFKWFVNIIKTITNQNTINIPNKIGEIHYSNKTIAGLSLQENNGPQYHILINGQQQVNGLIIISHRNIFRYHHIEHIPTNKKTRKKAFQEIFNDNINSYTNPQSYQKKKCISIKETILSWAISGSGNEYIEADLELKKTLMIFKLF